VLLDVVLSVPVEVVLSVTAVFVSVAAFAVEVEEALAVPFEINPHPPKPPGFLT
jgi:hypothetical protein